ncbi:hypothetical protein I79_004297 [Cricetulus griseus]|uniref:Uncharacterized protein n=1 Tax=Cricetulus griseus TaxID=10029 RepID=G3H252_CRIGR|nr:hypothetical protein I79_004297 [Cricetulus griseus]
MSLRTPVPGVLGLKTAGDSSQHPGCQSLVAMCSSISGSSSITGNRAKALVPGQTRGM